METNPVGTLTDALQLCAQEGVTVMTVFRCPFDKLPKDRADIIVNQHAQADQITLEAAEEKLRGTAIDLCMSNAAPDMDPRALLGMISESLSMQGQLAHDVLRTDQMRQAAEEKQEKSLIHIPGQ